MIAVFYQESLILYSSSQRTTTFEERRSTIAYYSVLTIRKIGGWKVNYLAHPPRIQDYSSWQLISDHFMKKINLILSYFFSMKEVFLTYNLNLGCIDFDSTSLQLRNCMRLTTAILFVTHFTLPITYSL